MQTVERRRGPRVPLYKALEIDTDTRKNRIGVTRDASDRGLLLASPSRFELGEKLTVRLLLSDGQCHVAKGFVARVEVNPPSSPEPWRYKVAVTLDASIPLVS